MKSERLVNRSKATSCLRHAGHLPLLRLAFISCLTTFVAATEATAGAPFTFENTTSLATARDLHTATLLPDGKVLVTGGNNDGIPIASAELYDPASGTWTPGGTLQSARREHTATLLPNGKVLVAGGSDSSGALADAELYDPLTGSWEATGSLGAARRYHTATLLSNGKVLVAGGQGTAGRLASAEVYDPASGNWTATGSLGTARLRQTATLLPNGKVLVTGGGGNSGTLPSAELYNPASESWTATGNLGNARREHTATLLPNGKVLVTGGVGSIPYLLSTELYDPATENWTPSGDLVNARAGHMATLLPNGNLLVTGGSDGSYLATAELYDPTSGTWSATGSLAGARREHTTTSLHNGKVLVSGGNNTSSLASAELYDPASGSWAATGSLAGARHRHTATSLPNGKVLLSGGDLNAVPLASAEVYDASSGSWAATGSLGGARQVHTATLLPSGKVLVTGGHGNSGTLSSAEVYDWATGTWTTTASLGNARQQHTATLLPNGKVLVVGGQGGSGSAEVYDPASGTWMATGSLGSQRYLHTATLLPNGKVLVVGGQGSSGSAELYDPESRSWTGTGGLGSHRESHTATLLHNGKVLVAGGYDGSTALAGAQIYDSASGSWTPTGNLSNARYFHTATLLLNGKVLVAGGSSPRELYDPASGTWTADSNATAARSYATATLLRDGKILVAGGITANGTLASAELYDVGLGFNIAWQPQISAASSILEAGSQLALSGARFRGISQASGGSFQDSSSNYPIVQLRSLDSSRVAFLPVDSTAGWSDTAFTSVPLSGVPFGPALVTVFTNGIPSEAKYLLVSPANPALSTQASAPVMIGGSVSDTAALSSGFNPTGTITFNVYGPDNAACGGVPVFTSAKTVDGNSNYMSDSFTPTSAGTYRFIASYSGDGNNAAVSGACNDANESVGVTKATPSISTQASGTTVVGGTISDTATLSNAVNPSGAITFTVYGPDDTTCGGTAVFTSAAVPVNGNGDYNSGNFSPTTPGTYRWIASYGGDGNNNAVSGTCNDANESVLVVNKFNPGISTQASAPVTIGGSISDTATLSSGFSPTGIITFNVYGPDNATCASSPVFTSTKTVNGNGDYTSDSFTPGSVGMYRFVASYGGDANNDPVAGACNDANESVVVTKATPAILTHASGTTVVGGTISDTATLSSGVNPGGTINFNVYGPDNATCAGSPVFTSTKTVNGNGDYTSDSFMPGSAGTYRFIAHYSGDGNNNPVSGACNDANESVQVTKATPAISTQASGDIAFGDTVSDLASLSGGATPGGTITFDLYGPNDANCGSSPVFTSVKSVSGNGTYASDLFAPPFAGVYRWIARYSGDANNQPATGACNDANETVNVTRATTSLAVSSSVNPSASGQSVTFTAAVSSSPGTPTGMVQFAIDGASAGGLVMLDGNGSATYITSSLSSGTHTITADYRGDANFAPSTGTLTPNQMVNATQSPTPRGFSRLSTQARAETGDNVLISGFVVTGNALKQVIARSLGPSLTASGAPTAKRLADPTLELLDGNGSLISSNDNWKDGPDALAIKTLGHEPPNNLESALLSTLPPGNYITTVAGKNGTSGIGMIDIVDVDPSTNSQLIGILSRAYAGMEDDVIVGGFIIEGAESQKVILRGLGPSLATAGVANTLVDPTVELRDGNGALLVVNNDWQDDPAQAAQLVAAGAAPSDKKESAIAATLLPGSYTAVLAGLCNGTGAGLLEIHTLGLAGNTTQIPASSSLSCSPPPTPRQGTNISTRGRVETGENVLIGGFIITEPSPRKVIIRAIGPSLTKAGITDALADPMLALHAANGSVITTNDNWKDTQRPEIEAIGIPPEDDLEAAVVATLQPGNYTAIASGKNQTSGVGLLEIYDLDEATNSKLANLSTRGIVRTGDNVLVGGFIFGENNRKTDVVVRAIGPSLTKAGINNPLADPTLTLHNSDGSIMTSNDDWKDGPQANEVKRKNLAPTDNRESAVLVEGLPPGPYTAIVAGKDGGTGIGLVEIYNLN